MKRQIQIKFIFLAIAICTRGVLTVDFNQACKTDGDCVHYFTEKYYCYEDHCRRIFLDFSIEEIVGLLLVGLFVAMTNAGGVGAGTVITPTLVILFEFPISLAIPQARIAITIGSLVTFVMTGLSRKVGDPNRFQTDYSLAATIAPLLFAGSQVGVLFARWFPALLLSSLLVSYICIALKQTYDRAHKEHAKEQLNSQNNGNEEKKSEMENKKGEGDEEKINLTDENKVEFREVRESILFRHKSELIREEAVNFSFILLSIVGFVLFSLIRGGRTIKSIVGIQECSPLSWVILLQCQIFCITLSLLSYYNNEEIFKIRDRELALKVELEEHEEFPHHARMKLIVNSYLAGIIAGCIGVGGGLIMNLYMLSLGMDVFSTTAMSNLIVLLSSASASFQFVAIGAVQIDNSLVFVAVALIGSIVGNLVFKRVLKRLGRPSLIVWLLFSVLWLALFALSFEAIRNIKRKGIAALEFGRFC